MLFPCEKHHDNGYGENREGRKEVVWIPNPAVGWVGWVEHDNYAVAYPWRVPTIDGIVALKLPFANVVMVDGLKDRSSGSWAVAGLQPLTFDDGNDLARHSRGSSVERKSPEQ